MSRTLEAALGYARFGIALFPVTAAVKKSHKCAEHSNGAKWGATRNPDEIRRDFARWPDAGIEIPTGVINNIVVVETDTIAGGHAHDGEPSLRELEAQHGPLPETLKAISPSGSVHRYFRHPGAGIKIKNSTSEIAPGVDVRGDGGMVLAPPTVRPGVGVYRWLNHNPIAPMPAWLVELTREKPRALPTISQRAVAAISRPIDGPNGYGTAALDDEIATLAIAAPGSRNTQANKSSFNLHQLVAGGELDGAEVRRRLIEACIANGLVADDGLPSVIATIESGMRAGLQHPRRRP